MTTREQLTAEKVERLLDVLAESQRLKDADDVTVAEARQRQAEAIEDVRDAIEQEEIRTLPGPARRARGPPEGGGSSP